MSNERRLPGLLLSSALSQCSYDSFRLATSTYVDTDIFKHTLIIGRSQW